MSNPYPDPTWVTNLLKAADEVPRMLAQIERLLDPKTWQPWQVNRLSQKLALDIAREARIRLQTALLPF